MRPAVARSSRFGVLLATLAFSASMSIGTASAHPSTKTAAGSSGSAQAAAPGSCPTIMPLAHVHKGQVGTGWTVVQGHTPRPFVVHILGILPGWRRAGSRHDHRQDRRQAGQPFHQQGRRDLGRDVRLAGVCQSPARRLGVVRVHCLSVSRRRPDAGGGHAQGPRLRNGRAGARHLRARPRHPSSVHASTDRARSWNHRGTGQHVRPAAPAARGVGALRTRARPVPEGARQGRLPGDRHAGLISRPRLPPAPPSRRQSRAATLPACWPTATSPPAASAPRRTSAVAGPSLSDIR